ncbi:MAG: SRPBCC family protein [Terriglobia bacterium]
MEDWKGTVETVPFQSLPMKIEGTYKIPAPREAVWQHLMSPESLARALPGCEKLEPAPDGSFHAVLKIGIGAVKGTYEGHIELADVVPPEQYRMKVEGKGAGGFVKGEGTLSLSADSPAGTTIHYSGEAQVGGVIASAGQRLVQAAARQIVRQFFQALARQVEPS